jgi:hypothetical protein
MRPEEAKTVADFLLSTIEGEIAITTSVFGAVPDDKLDYRPDNVSRTALGLLRHLTLEDEWLLNAVADGRFSPLPDDSDACGVMTPKDASARYRERVPAAIARVKALSGEALMREVDLFGMIEDAGCGLFVADGAPLRPSPRAAERVSPGNGRQGAADLRAQWRHADDAGVNRQQGVYRKNHHHRAQ